MLHFLHHKGGSWWEGVQGLHLPSPPPPPPWSESDYNIIITSGDEKHLYRASLRKNHKISLKAQRHGAWADIPKYVSQLKLPRECENEGIIVQ